jgi:hypothetical protein
MAAATSALQRCEIAEIGNKLRVHLDLAQRLGAAHPLILLPEIPDQGFHPGVDIGAVEGRDAGIGKGDHVFDTGLAVDIAMSAGQLPATLDDTGNPVPRARS